MLLHRRDWADPMIPTVSVPSIQGRTGEPGSDTSTFEHQARPYRRVRVNGGEQCRCPQSQTITRSARARSMAHVSGFQSRLRSL